MGHPCPPRPGSRGARRIGPARGPVGSYRLIYEVIDDVVEIHALIRGAREVLTQAGLRRYFVVRLDDSRDRSTSEAGLLVFWLELLADELRPGRQLVCYRMGGDEFLGHRPWMSLELGEGQQEHR